MFLGLNCRTFTNPERERQRPSGLTGTPAATVTVGADKDLAPSMLATKRVTDRRQLVAALRCGRRQLSTGSPM